MDPWDLRAPIDLLGDFLQVIQQTPNLDHLLLSKRPQNCVPRIKAVLDHYAKVPSINDSFCAWLETWLDGIAPENVWLGVTTENQRRADERIPILREIPAVVRWLSVEPLIEPVRLDLTAVDWVVVGGESGLRRRDCGPESIIGVAEQCQAAGVPVWVKQDCSRFPGESGRLPPDIWSLKQLPSAKGPCRRKD